ncbi:transcription elongation factor B polypeptide 3 isoform X2 [Arapaima gigas]
MSLRPSGAKDMRSHQRGADGRNGGRKRPRDPSPEEPRYVEQEEEEEEEEEVEEQEQDEKEVDRGYRPSYSPSSLQHRYSPLQGGYRSEGYESPPEEEPEPVPSPPRKEVKHMKPHKDPAKERPSHSDRESERRRHHGDAPRRADGSSDGKKRAAESEQQGGAAHKATKHSSHSGAHGGKQGKKEKDKRGTSEGESQERRSRPEVVQRADEEEEESFEAPTMSFESFLTYDAPSSSRKKKKKQSPRAAPSSQPPPAPASSIPTKPSKVNGTHGKQPEPPAATASLPPVAEKRRKVIDVVPTLPDIPLPAIQPNYRPLPSIDITPLSPQRRKVPVSCDEEDAGFSGHRLNTKTGVYSGSKTAYLPKMMSLYEQCIRVLQNNIDSIEEVGGVPFEILEPVLERCTPEQLFRIEQCNQWFTEETDELWMRHCRRDFKHESPQEYESWREMYLRLHEEREERLRLLTQNISSAHAQRPKGRQVKMAYVNSVVKPPRDVRRRQEKFGTAGGSSSGGAGSSSSHSPVQIRPAAPYSSQSGDSVRSGQSSAPLPVRSSGGAQAIVGGGHGARDKPQVKKIAPMMAKTIKAFKNRFSRR